MLVGDFNNNSWKDEFGEWKAAHGIWTVSDPSTPTFRSGRSLGKFLFVPGTEAPEAFLLVYSNMGGDPREANQWDEDEDSPNYPAYTTYIRMVVDHHPASLDSRSGQIDPDPPPHQTLRVKHLTQEGWAKRNAQVRKYLSAKKDSLEELSRLRKSSRILDILYAAKKRAQTAKK